MARGGQSGLHPDQHTGSGHGRPLVCLHPLPHSGAFFDRFKAASGGTRPLLAPDYPGYGRSPAPRQPPTIELYAAAIAARLTAEPAIRADGATHALGFHTGCLVAIELALRYPNLIDQLVLVDIPYFPPPRRAELARDYAADDSSQAGFRAAFSYECEARFAAVTHDGLIIATSSSLREPTRAAAKRLQHMRYSDADTVVKPAFEAGAATLAALVGGFLRR